MTKTELRKKYHEIRRRTNRMLAAYLDQALKSNAVDLTQYEDNYRLPKTILCAALDEVRWQWAPKNKGEEKTIRNITLTTNTDWTQVP